MATRLLINPRVLGCEWVFLRNAIDIVVAAFDVDVVALIELAPQSCFQLLV